MTIEIESMLNYLSEEELEMMQRRESIDSYKVGYRDDREIYYYNVIVNGKVKHIKSSKYRHVVVEAAIKYHRQAS